MTDPALTPEERTAVEGLVDQATGTPATVVHDEVIWGRAHAVRARLADDREVVVKRPRRDRNGHSPATSLDAWHREWWGLTILAEVDPPIGPRLHGADPDVRVIVMESLPAGRSVAASLLDADPADATAALVALATSLGRLHAATVGGARARELAVATGVRQPDAEIGDVLAEGLAALRAADLSVEIPAECEAELQTVATALAGEGTGAAWRTFVHRDPCPDNTRRTADGEFRLFDFERGAIANAALDAAHLVAPMPTCWCFGRLPEATARAAVEAYEDAVRQVFPVDDLPRQLAYSMTGSVIARMVGLTNVLGTDHSWGTTGVRPRTLRWLDAAAHQLEAIDELPALRRACASAADVLRDRWPEAVDAWYPAFAPDGDAATVDVPPWWDPTL
jgi:hypothetical protein